MVILSYLFYPVLSCVILRKHVFHVILSLVISVMLSFNILLAYSIFVYSWYCHICRRFVAAAVVQY